MLAVLDHNFLLRFIASKTMWRMLQTTKQSVFRGLSSGEA